MITHRPNPLLEAYVTPLGVPPFGKISPEHYVPAFRQAMDEENRAIAELLVSVEHPTVANFLVPLARAGERLDRIARLFYNVEAAETSPALQAIAEEIAPLLAAHADAILQDKTLYGRLCALPTEGLSASEQRLLDQTLLRFRRAGAELNPESAARVRQINQELSLLQLRFGRNVLDETNAGELVVENETDLDGLPASVIAGAAQAAAGKGLPGKWLFTSHKPSLLPFLTYSTSAKLRAALYELYYTRGNRRNANDNNAVVTQIVALRRERAKLLGFGSHADYALEGSMAIGPERVRHLLLSLWPAAIAKAREELAELQQLARHDGLERIQPSDWWYYAERVRSERYDFDEEELRPYLSIERAREAIFTLARELYGLEFERRCDLPVYHPDVEAYRVFEADGTHLAVLYLDYYPRPGKSAGAWCTTYQPYRIEAGGRITHPVVSIVCNFTAPVGDAPALLSFDEVETLFHEFGHALHAFFTRAPWPGMGSVPRDFVELPSQMLEHWASEPLFLKRYARHYLTDQQMPDELIERLRASRRFNQGFNLTEYLAAAILDLEYHETSELIIYPQAFEESVLQKYDMPAEILPRYRTTYFSHIFDGGYSSAYYSYIWSEALDCDAYEAFRAQGLLFDREVAAAFRRHILQWGGAREARELWLSFMGRDVDITPLLHHRGVECSLTPPLERMNF